MSPGRACPGGADPLTRVAPLADARVSLDALAPTVPVPGATSLLESAEPDGDRTPGPCAPAEAFVEVVDPATGVLVRRAKLGEGGRYSLALEPHWSLLGLLVQVTVVSGGAVTGFLVAPVPARPSQEARRAVVDVDLASTIVVFSTALASGIREELKVDTGFRGFGSARLAFLVAHTDTRAVGLAAARLDGLSSLSEGESFDAVLGAATSGAVALANASAEIARAAGGTLATLIAACNGILVAIGDTTVDRAADLVEVVSTAASRANRDEIAAEAAAVADRPGVAPPVDASRPLGPPPPIATPSPTPTPQPTATPRGTPTPAPTASALGGYVIHQLPPGHSAPPPHSPERPQHRERGKR